MSNSGVFVSGLITYSLSADADCSLLFFSTPLHSPLVSLSYLQPFPYSLVNCSFLANSGLPDALCPFPRSSLPIRSSSLWLFVCVWVWIVFKYGYVSHGMIFGENGSGSWKECLSSSLVCLSGADTIFTFYYDYSTPFHSILCTPIKQNVNHNKYKTHLMESLFHSEDSACWGRDNRSGSTASGLDTPSST